MLHFFGFALILLFMQLPFVANAICEQIVPSDQPEYSDFLPNSQCKIEILPNATHSIRLTSTSPTPLIVWQTFNSTYKFPSVPFKNITNQGFVVQRNTGLMVRRPFEMYYSGVPFIKLERFVEADSPCGEMEQTVGQLQKIQFYPLESVSRSCFYNLTHKGSNNDTLFLFFEPSAGNSEWMISVGDRVPIENDFLMVPNWSSVNILATLINGKPSKLATITAASVQNTCDCGPKNYILSNDSVVLRTPSLPDFSCPNLNCVTEILPLSENEVEDYIPRVLVSTKELGTKNTVQFQFRTATSTFTMNGSFPCEFLLDTHVTTISYKTPAAFFNGAVEMSLSKVNIHVDCECSTLFEKAYHRDYRLRIVIPASCELMFCHWNVDVQHAHLTGVGYIIEISLQNAGTNDTVHVFGDEIKETYNDEELKWPRMVHVTQSDKANIAFWRKQSGPEATLDLRWRVLGIIYTEPLKSIPLTTEPTTVVSPFYPANHDNFLDLTYRFFAPRNHQILMHIDEVDVEKIHDHFAVYEGIPGNSTELKYLTGLHKNISLFSTGDTLFIKFVSDGHASGRGFHINVVAVPVIQSEENSLTVSTTILEQSSSSSHPIIVVFLVFLIIAIALGFFMMREKILECGRTGNFNPLVRFRSQDDGSSVDISI